jgi:hypothetical protein
VADYSRIPNHSGNVYAWLNYITFEILVGAPVSQVERIFRDALMVLFDLDDRKRIWIEYIAFTNSLNKVNSLCAGFFLTRKE